MQGDAFIMAFHEPRDAISWAVVTQQVCQLENLASSSIYATSVLNISIIYNACACSRQSISYFIFGSNGIYQKGCTFFVICTTAMYFTRGVATSKHSGICRKPHGTGFEAKQKACGMHGTELLCAHSGPFSSRLATGAGASPKKQHQATHGHIYRQEVACLIVPFQISAQQSELEWSNLVQLHGLPLTDSSQPFTLAKHMYGCMQG